MKLMNKIAQLGIAGAFALGLASQANALVLCVGDTIPLQTTNWNGTITIPKFDPSLGVLTSIEFYLEGEVESHIRVESLDNEPALITATNSAKISLMRPDMTPLNIIEPTATETFNASAYDGTSDFGGTSGKDFGVTMISDSQTTSSSAASDLALFTGIGDIILPVNALGTSSATGSGNLLTFITTEAGATVCVNYNYRPTSEVPEPGTVAFLATGAISGIGLAIRRRRCK